MDKHARARIYGKAYLSDYGFESVMVSARQRRVLETIRRIRPARILEAGCGAELLSKRATAGGVSFANWTIVEPTAEFLAIARDAHRDDRAVSIKPGFLEDQVTDLVDDGGPFDLVILSGLLNEIPEPAVVLGAARQAVSPAGLVHVDVPNAYSLHRRLARAMGLIEDEHEMSARNGLLEQYRVFDPATLHETVVAAGFDVIESGGYMIKPFTHEQMESLSDVLSEQMLDGLWQLGVEHPDLASEIYVDATPCR